MKIPLRFQLTEFDCGTVTLQNAISYLFERENIPPEIIRAISVYTLDCYDKNGNIGQGGTSVEAIELMGKWIKNYTQSHDFNIRVEHLLNSDVTFSKIIDIINNNGCAVLRTYQGGEHYVLITDIDNNYVYIWDPYYFEEDYYDKDKMIKIIFDKPFDYNRRVDINRFLSNTHKDFALGLEKNRELLLFEKTK